MPNIQIRQTMGAIGVEVQKARVEIQQNHPSFKIKSKPARFKINKKLPGFRIKQGEHLFASGYRTNLALSSLKFQKARQRTIEAIGRIASEGDALMRIENRANPVPQMAIQNAEEHVDLQVGMLPRNEIQWDVGYINIEWTPHQMDFEWNVQSRPNIVVHPHYVKIFMRKNPSISITSNKTNIYSKNRSIKAGRTIDRKI